LKLRSKCQLLFVLPCRYALIIPVVVTLEPSIFAPPRKGWTEYRLCYRRQTCLAHRAGLSDSTSTIASEAILPSLANFSTLAADAPRVERWSPCALPSWARPIIFRMNFGVHARTNSAGPSRSIASGRTGRSGWSSLQPCGIEADHDVLPLGRVSTGVSMNQSVECNRCRSGEVSRWASSILQKQRTVILFVALHRVPPPKESMTRSVRITP
jgi:hypothetical protein